MSSENKNNTSTSTSTIELSGKTVKLGLNGGEVVEVPRDYVLMCQTLKNMLEDFPEDDEKIVPIMCDRANREVMDLMFGKGGYCEHHFFHPNEQFVPDEKDKKTFDRTQICEFDKKFLQPFMNKEGIKKIKNLIIVSNFLELKGLLHLGCKTIANMITEKTPEELGKIKEENK